MRPPGPGEQADEVLAVEAVDRLDVALPAALVAVHPRVADALVAEALLDEGDEPEQAAGHEVVQHLPLVLHLLAEAPDLGGVAAVERLDRAVHRGARQVALLFRVAPVSPLAPLQAPPGCAPRVSRQRNSLRRVSGAVRLVAL